MTGPRVTAPPPIPSPDESRTKALEAAQRERRRRASQIGRQATILGGAIGINPPFQATALGA